MRYSINQFKELFNNEEFNQLWSKYELDDDTYDVDDAYIGKRHHKQKLNKLKLQKTKDKRYRLSTLVKMFNTKDPKLLNKYYFDYEYNGHHIKMYVKTLRYYLETDEERSAYKELSLKEAILLIRRVQSLLSYDEQQEVIALANKYQRHDYIQRRIKRCRRKINGLW